MHAITLDHRQTGSQLDLLAQMFRLRRRVFRDRLDWTVSVSGDLEIDIYDTLAPTHVLVVSDDNVVLGCVRLLPTTGPTMLADTFPILLGDKEAPRSELVLESSRFCVDTERVAEIGQRGFNRATFVLFAAMIETMRTKGANAIVTVTDVRMERILRRAYWPLERLTEPRKLGQTIALAGYLRDSDLALEAMYRQAGLAGPVVRKLPEGRKAA
ncbi:GNAT family N-acetyltransferase [Bradyrhizobium barranii subsp. apii]|uniref:acyl-homoserine-lactone synthase n=1 Tax=Bradyrhizobium barranii subsp. apii TaxID=2819348 RepID=A0A8T5V5G0_9BRAD|nr:acyl-homoserine-lactone synthase [Bradyrhizobium barranii]UPT84608.1 GNAT family N-acetyltransferase [Bradyrhizobium barranii subsp. apii]UPT93195.1 GNAT family N-acetyltransferase [Bradyrhizobium barranii subsp. apii]